jgi:hypothetical protein
MIVVASDTNPNNSVTRGTGGASIHDCQFSTMLTNRWFIVEVKSVAAGQPQVT